MNKVYSFLSLMFFVVSTFGQELLVNPGFENWSDGMPDGWGLVERLTQETSDVYNGKSSARQLGGVARLSQLITDLTPGEKITLSIWYKVEKENDGTDVRIWSKWSKDGVVHNTLNKGVLQRYLDNNECQWTKYSVDLTVPFGINEFNFEVRTYADTQVLWDEFSFYKTSESIDYIEFSFNPEVVCDSNTKGENNDKVSVRIPYLGLDSGIESLSTNSSHFIIVGDNPKITADGCVVIENLQEGDVWEVTINGGACDGQTISGTISSTHCDPSYLVINEILADPHATDGDANADGIVDSSEDEFIELYNTSSEKLDISGFTIYDAKALRHEFVENTVIAPHSFLTIFGGGNPTQDVGGLTLTATTGRLNLNNTEETITIYNTKRDVVAEYTYNSDADKDQSIARNPDFEGDFVKHTTIVGEEILYSPGLPNAKSTMSFKDLRSQKVDVYPNPIKNILNVRTTTKSEKTLYVYNVMGQLLLMKKILFDATINIDLPSGLYILLVEDQERYLKQQLIID